MSSDKRIVVDANILLRWVLGNRVPDLLIRYAAVVEFFVPEGCYEEAARNILQVEKRRSNNLGSARRTLEESKSLTTVIGVDDFELYEADARMRMRSRDETDWPIVAAALFLDCPIWTEDRDFFGCGVGTWMTSTVEIYLEA